MKKIMLLAVVSCAAVNLFAEPGMVRLQKAGTSPEELRAAARQNAIDQRAADAADVAEKQKYFVPRDPWREILFEVSAKSGFRPAEYSPKTSYAKGEFWYQFTGTVQEVRPDGIIVRGWFGDPMDFKHGRTNVLFKVLSFPYKVTSGTALYPAARYVARIQGEGVFDYGKVMPTPGAQVSQTASQK